VKRAPLRSLVGPVMGLAVAVVVANVAVFAAWTAPRWSARWAVVGASRSAEGVRLRVEPAVQRMRDTYGRVNRAEQDIEAFRAHMTNSVGGSDLLGMLMDAADTVGIRIDDASLQYSPVDDLGVARLGITLPVTGTYEAVRHLLDELLYLPVFLIVDGIGLQAVEQGTVPRPGLGSAGDAVRVDLALSVFVDDDELDAALSTTPPPPIRVSAAAAREAENLRRAMVGDDAGELADALMARLAALPPLPVDADSLTIDLQRLDLPPEVVEPSRNLFSIPPPPAPPPAMIDEPLEMTTPEPDVPVRLLGVLLVEGRWHASLTDDVELFVVQAGDRLPNGVHVIEVGADYAELEFNDRRTRLTLEGSRP